MSTLLEDKRNDLISQSRRGEKEKDGKTRYEKRVKSKVASTVREFNQIDMNNLFKHGILTVNIPVRGETNNYIVKIKFGGFLDILHRQLKDKDRIDLKIITKSLLEAFNQDDVYIHCNCPDFKFRLNFWSTVKDINSGEPENRPAKITNPKNNKGAGCKHILLVLSNNFWLIKVASVINNYIIYMEKNRKKEYADIIYPALYGKKYQEPVQLSIDDRDELTSDEIDVANKQGRVRGRFTPGNTYRFRNKPDKNQLSIEGEEPSIKK